MKKSTGIIATLIFTLLLVACTNHQKIRLPESKDVTEIELVINVDESSKRIIQEEEIRKIITGIKENTKPTAKESVNDQPTNIDEYDIVRFKHNNAENNPSIIYLYKDKDICYVEQPYSGIWVLKNETYNDIISLAMTDKNKI